MENNDFRKVFKSMFLKDKSNLDDCILTLKNMGASQIECVKTIVLEMNIGLSKADKIILNSDAWKHKKEENENFRNEFGSYLEDL